jgi:hypothetical protein
VRHHTIITITIGVGAVICAAVAVAGAVYVG